MHRGAEKLFEARDYRQIIVLANRHDWLSAFSNELGVVLAVERMLGMEVPQRAVWARTLLAELNRVLNHLMFLGSYPIELGAITPMFYAFREREELQEVMEEVSGGRMHYMFNRVGGLKEDIPAGWPDRARRVVRPSAARCATTSTTWSAATRSSAPARAGVGVLSAEQVAQSTACPGRSPGPPASTSTCAATSRTSPTASSAGRPAGRHADRGRLPRAVRVPARPGLRLARPRRRLPGPAGRPAAGPDQRAAAEGGQGARGRHLRLDREPARHQRLLPGLTRREDAVAAEAALRVVQQRPGARRAAAGLPASPTWSRSSARCSSSSATSTSRR